MAVVKAKKLEVEIQEQTMPDAAARWMVVLKYEPEDYMFRPIALIKKRRFGRRGGGKQLLAAR